MGAKHCCSTARAKEADEDIATPEIAVSSEISLVTSQAGENISRSDPLNDEVDENLSIKQSLQPILLKQASPGCRSTASVERKKSLRRAPSDPLAALQLGLPVYGFDRTFSDPCPPSPIRFEGSKIPCGVVPPDKCRNCSAVDKELFLDPWDQWRYCKWCWVSHPDNPSGIPPSRWTAWPLVPVEVAEIWQERHLLAWWAEHPLPAWPPDDPSLFSNGVPPVAADKSEEFVSTMTLRMRKDIVGPHARDYSQEDRIMAGEVVKERYRIVEMVGEGAFMEAFLAEDLKSSTQVCLKRHKSLSVEDMADMIILDKRLRTVDPQELFFPKLHEAFYDIVGFTVESLLHGQNCFNKAADDRSFFQALANLRPLARGLFNGLARLDQAGIVHNDLKPDNLVWIDASSTQNDKIKIKQLPCVKIIDFNLARLDKREEPHRNWCLMEGGAGHRGYWSPEMSLGLPISHRSDVWSASVTICELYCSRLPYSDHTANNTEIVTLAQAMGLCGLTDGLPSKLLQRSPLDVQRRFTPAHMPVKGHLPIRRTYTGRLEALRPTTYGIEQVLGENWRTDGKRQLGHFLQAALVFDDTVRPSAKMLLDSCQFLKAAVPPKKKPAPKTH